MKKRFSKEQIVGIFREAEAGVFEAVYYALCSKHGGMKVADVKRLKSLETENARLKRLLAESLLENEVTREAL